MNYIFSFTKSRHYGQIHSESTFTKSNSISNRNNTVSAKAQYAVSTFGEQLSSNNLGSSSSSSKKIIESKKSKYVPKMFDVWALVMTTVLYGQYYGWNVALVSGFGSFVIGQFLIGMAYICFAFSLAEIVSTTTFSGGAYGMARVVLGFYPGFLIASFELMEYITYVSSAIYWFAQFLCIQYNWDTSNVIPICVISYVVLILILLEQNYFFWRLNKLLAVSTLLVLLIYCFGALPYTDFQANAPFKFPEEEAPGYYYYYAADDTSANGLLGNNSSSTNSTSTILDTLNSHDSQAWFQGGMVAFLQLLPYATYGFAGVECAALISDEIENPRINLAYGIASSVLTLFAMMMFILFVSVSLPPGLNYFATAPYFMNEGWKLMGISNEIGEWLIIPTQLAMAFGFAIPCFKLVSAMASSHLFPAFCGLQNKNHVAAILFANLISFLTCLLPYYFPDVNLSNIATIFACITYLSDLYAYYKMKTDFASRDHKFTNPFGIPGAIFAAIMFILTIISLIFYQIDYSTIYAVLLYLVFLTIYYYAYAKKHQQFSDDEQKTLLVLHVMGNNKRKRVVKKPKQLWVDAKQNNVGLFERANSVSSFGSGGNNCGVGGQNNGRRNYENSTGSPPKTSVSLRNNNNSAHIMTSYHNPSHRDTSALAMPIALQQPAIINTTVTAAKIGPETLSNNENANHNNINNNEKMLTIAEHQHELQVQHQDSDDHKLMKLISCTELPAIEETNIVEEPSTKRAMMKQQITNE